MTAEERRIFRVIVERYKEWRDARRSAMKPEMPR